MALTAACPGEAAVIVQVVPVVQAVSEPTHEGAIVQLNGSTVGVKESLKTWPVMSVPDGQPLAVAGWLQAAAVNTAVVPCETQSPAATDEVTTTAATVGCTRTDMFALIPLAMLALMAAVQGEAALQVGRGLGAEQTIPAASQRPPQITPVEVTLAMALLLEV